MKHDWLVPWWKCPTCLQHVTVARWYHIKDVDAG